MKCETKRQQIIRGILSTHGSIDYLDSKCLAVRFRVSPETILEDIQRVREKLAEEARAQKRAAVLARERAAELALARRIMRGEV
jgi:transcriptional antiterminator